MQNRTPYGIRLCIFLEGDECNPKKALHPVGSMFIVRHHTAHNIPFKQDHSDESHANHCICHAAGNTAKNSHYHAQTYKTRRISS